LLAGAAGIAGALADGQLGQDSAEFFGPQLLCCVADRLFGAAMRFNHQAVKIEVEGFLGDFSDAVAAASNMARIAEERYSGQVLPQVNGDLP